MRYRNASTRRCTLSYDTGADLPVVAGKPSGSKDDKCPDSALICVFDASIFSLLDGETMTVDKIKRDNG